MIEQTVEETKVDEKDVTSVTTMAETKVAATGLRELVDVPEADEVRASGPSVQGLDYL